MCFKTVQNLIGGIGGLIGVGDSQRKQEENARDRQAALQLQEANRNAEEAQLERQRQEEREANIRQGMADVDTGFAQFDDPFYDERRQSVVNALLPDLEKQKSKAQRDLTLSLAKSGQLQSSTAAKKARELAEQFKAGRTSIDEKAAGAVNSLKGDVLSERSRLYDTVRGSPDPRGTAAALSSASAQRFAEPSSVSFDSLGPIFQNLSAGIQAAEGARVSSERRRLADAYAKSVNPTAGSTEKTYG